MRNITYSMALGVALVFSLCGGAALAQDQPAAGSPPPASTTAPVQNNQAAPPADDAAPPPPADNEAPAPPDMQDRRGPNPQRQARMLARRLALTPDQESKVETILAARQQQVASIRADATLTPKERRISLRGISQDSDSKITAVLTDAQKQAYMQWKQEQRAKREQRKEQQTEAPAAPGGNL